MQVSKDYIRKDILTAAQKLFLKKGYSNVSMREISEKSGVGLSNMYNYFQNKDHLFCTIAQPAVTALEHMIEQNETQAEQGDSILTEDFLRNRISEYLVILKKNRTETTLLLFGAGGSSLQDFKENFTRRQSEQLKQVMNKLNPEISDFFIQFHSVWMFSFLEEFLHKKIKNEELEKILDQYIRFVMAGWKELIRG